MNDDLVKVCLRFRAGTNLPLSESMWAKPLVAHDGGGTYSLANISFFLPLAAGDAVRAQVNADGALQVVELVGAADCVLTAFRLSPKALDDRDSVLEDWRAGGARWTEGDGDLLTTIWSERLSVAEVVSTLERSQVDGWGEQVMVARPEDRVVANMPEIDFEVLSVPSVAPVETTYWVGDDPWWAEHGLDDPELLAFVQRLASEDEQVARALERGQQDRVMLYVERISAPDPSILPPLEGPIFED